MVKSSPVDRQLKSVMGPSRSLTASLPLKNDGKGRQAFPSGSRYIFRGRTVKLPGGSKLGENLNCSPTLKRIDGGISFKNIALSHSLSCCLHLLISVAPMRSHPKHGMESASEGCNFRQLQTQTPKSSNIVRVTS